MATSEKPRFLQLNLPARRVVIERRSEGVLVLRSPVALDAYPRKISDRIFATAAHDPTRLLLAQRMHSGDWRRLSYGDAVAMINALGESLLSRDLGRDRPIAMLSGSSIEHASLAFAALHVGIPYASITPAYSLLSDDFAKLRHVMNLLTPGLVFVDDCDRYARAIAAAVPPGTEIVAVNGADRSLPCTHFSSLLTTERSARVADAAGAVQADDVAKFLFTSGSTGMPKAVTVTHRMWCADQQMFLQAMPFLGEKPPVFVDWLPWHHTSGGNQSIGMTLYLGGSLYIDEGKPTREGIAETIRNLREIQPTAYFSAPKGFAEIMPFLRADDAFAKRFFSAISMFFYSGASLSRPLLAEMNELSQRTIGLRVPVMSAYGATETAPFALIANWPSERTGLAGLPLPGTEIKLVPFEGKYEVRVKGPIVTPGYWRQPELTAKLFDDEGYLCLGDSLSFVDDGRPEEGLAFEGRIAEDFKLTTGTWVNVGRLRDRFLKEAGLIARDVVIVGENRDQIGALVFLSAHDAEDLLGRGTLGMAELAAAPKLRAHFQDVLDALRAEATGSSNLIAFAVLMPCEPSPEAGEITDKGSISQRNVVKNRRDLIDLAYDDPRGAGALIAGESAGVKIPRRSTG